MILGGTATHGQKSGSADPPSRPMRVPSEPRRYSQESNVELREIARRVCAQGDLG